VGVRPFIDVYIFFVNDWWGWFASLVDWWVCLAAKQGSMEGEEAKTTFAVLEKQDMEL